MSTPISELLKRVGDPQSEELLRTALAAENPFGRDTRAALIGIFIKATNERETGTKPSLGAEAIAISVLLQRRDYETLFRLAVCTSIPGRPQLLSERCLDATLAAGEWQEIYDLILDELDFEGEETLQAAIVGTAAKLLLRLAEKGFHPAYLTLGDLFKHGIGFPTDFQKARSWYARAAFVNSFEASNLAGKVATAYRELLELLETNQDSGRGIRVAEFFRVQASLAEEFSRRSKAFIPDQVIDCLIERGERCRTEFKATLRWDIKTQRVNSDLEKAAIEEVAAFMNADGGTLLIGVSNNGDILGLEPDYQSFTTDKTKDKFERHLRQILRNALGGNIGLCAIDFVELGDKDLCQITVRRAPEAVFLVGDPQKKLWLRDGNAKRALAAVEAETFLRKHRSGEIAWSSN